MILLDSMWHIKKKKKRHLAAVPNSCRKGVEEATFPGFSWHFSAIPVAEVVQSMCKAASVCAEVSFNLNFIWSNCDGGNILVLSKIWEYLRGLVLDKHSWMSGKKKDKTPALSVSQNHGIIWVGRDLQEDLIPNPDMDREITTIPSLSKPHPTILWFPGKRPWCYGAEFASDRF